MAQILVTWRVWWYECDSCGIHGHPYIREPDVVIGCHGCSAFEKRQIMTKRSQDTYEVVVSERFVRTWRSPCRENDELLFVGRIMGRDILIDGS